MDRAAAAAAAAAKEQEVSTVLAQLEEEDDEDADDGNDNWSSSTDVEEKTFEGLSPAAVSPVPTTTRQEQQPHRTNNQPSPLRTPEAVNPGCPWERDTLDGKLWNAACCGRAADVATFIERGANVNCRWNNDQTRWTPLIAAAYHGREAAVVQLLLSPDLDLNMRGRGGKTALAHARAEGFESIVMLLQEAAAQKLLTNLQQAIVSQNWTQADSYLRESLRQEFIPGCIPEDLFNFQDPQAILLSSHSAWWYDTDLAIQAADYIVPMASTVKLANFQLPQLPNLLRHVRTLTTLQVLDTKIESVDWASLPSNVSRLHVSRCADLSFQTLRTNEHLKTLIIDSTPIQAPQLPAQLHDLVLQNLSTDATMAILTDLAAACPALASLTISNCGLEWLPSELGNCGHLHTLNVADGNPLSLVPPDILQVPRLLLAYLRAGVPVPCSFAKMVLIGSAFEGKSTLFQALQTWTEHGSLPAAGVRVAQRTRGIATQPWVIAHHPIWVAHYRQQASQVLPATPPKTSPVPPLTFSVFDLAGQNTYYSAQQPFLSASHASLTHPLFLLVVNLCDWGGTRPHRIVQWLDYISNSQPGAAVMLVGTHVDCIGVPGADAAAAGSESAMQRMHTLLKIADAWYASQRRDVERHLKRLETQARSGAINDYDGLMTCIKQLQDKLNHPVILAAAAAIDCVRGEGFVSKWTHGRLTRSSVQWTPCRNPQPVLDLIMHTVTKLSGHMHHMVPTSWSELFQAAVTRHEARQFTSGLLGQFGNKPFVPVSQLAAHSTWSALFATASAVSDATDVYASDMLAVERAITAACEFGQGLGLMTVLMDRSKHPLIVLDNSWLLDHIAQLVFHMRFRPKVVVDMPSGDNAELDAEDIPLPFTLHFDHPVLRIAPQRCAARTLSDALELHEHIFPEDVGIAPPEPPHVIARVFTSRQADLDHCRSQLERWLNEAITSRALGNNEDRLMSFLGVGVGTASAYIKAGVLVGRTQLAPAEELVIQQRHNPASPARRFVSTGIADDVFLSQLWKQPTEITLVLTDACMSLGIMCLIPKSERQLLVPGMIPWPVPATWTPQTVSGWWPARLLGVPVSVHQDLPWCMRRRFVFSCAPLFLLPSVLTALLVSRCCKVTTDCLHRSCVLLHALDGSEERVLLMLRSDSVHPSDSDIFAPPVAEHLSTVYSHAGDSMALDVIAWYEAPSSTLEFQVRPWSLFRNAIEQVRRSLVVLWPGLLIDAEAIEVVPVLPQRVLPWEDMNITMESVVTLRQYASKPNVWAHTLVPPGEVAFGQRFFTSARSDGGLGGMGCLQATDIAAENSPCTLQLMSNEDLALELDSRLPLTSLFRFEDMVVPHIHAGRVQHTGRSDCYLVYPQLRQPLASYLCGGDMTTRSTLAVMQRAVEIAEWLLHNHLVTLRPLLGNLVSTSAGAWCLLRARDLCAAADATRFIEPVLGLVDLERLLVWQVGVIGLSALASRPINAGDPASIRRLLRRCLAKQHAPSIQQLLHARILPMLCTAQLGIADAQRLLQDDVEPVAGGAEISTTAILAHAVAVQMCGIAASTRDQYFTQIRAIHHMCSDQSPSTSDGWGQQSAAQVYNRYFQLRWLGFLAAAKIATCGSDVPDNAWAAVLTVCADSTTVTLNELSWRRVMQQFLQDCLELFRSRPVRRLSYRLLSVTQRRIWRECRMAGLLAARFAEQYWLELSAVEHPPTTWLGVATAVAQHTFSEDAIAKLALRHAEMAVTCVLAGCLSDAAASNMDLTLDAIVAQCRDTVDRPVLPVSDSPGVEDTKGTDELDSGPSDDESEDDRLQPADPDSNSGDSDDALEGTGSSDPSIGGSLADAGFFTPGTTPGLGSLLSQVSASSQLMDQAAAATMPQSPSAPAINVNAVLFEGRIERFQRNGIRRLMVWQDQWVASYARVTGTALYLSESATTLAVVYPIDRTTRVSEKRRHGKPFSLRVVMGDTALTLACESLEQRHLMSEAILRARLGTMVQV